MLIPVVLFAAASVLGVAQAGVIFDNTDYAMHPDIPFEIKWINNRGPVNISLQNGLDSDLKLVLIVTNMAPGKSYMWTPPTTLKKDGYELVIQDGVSTDWSQRFQYPAPSIESSTTDSLSTTSSTTFSTTTAPPTAILTTTATATITTDTAASPTTTGTQTPTALPTTDTGLTAGAKAGLGVGVTLAVLALIGLAFFLFHRRSKKASNKRNAAASLDHHGDGAAPTPFAELGDFDVKELAGAGTPAAWGGGGGKAYEPTHTHMGYSNAGGRRDINTAWSNCSKCAAGSTPVAAYSAPYHAAEVAELSSEPQPYR
ncbi:hypothetical protein B0T22DRAFT_430507 [Podospora appendiculata]|uniref:Uncharacterized protein n=1 Tax=Podospora appendiculata TaxID=314037 RepID=A0AAE0X1X4_9PEZI|nr:hypothetical protein B0T22DRAFT_430507 [Podospora appendiculata]